jgi:preprotein translocase subunit SecF
MEWIKPGTNIDFVGTRGRWMTFSGVLVLLACVLLSAGWWAPDFVFAPRAGVDFAGGTEIHLKVDEGIDIGAVRKAVAAIGLSNDNVQTFGGSGNEFLVRVQSINYGADEFFDKAVTKLKELHGEAAWTSFDWQRGQSVSMSIVAKEAQDAAALQAELRALDPEVTVTESKVEHNAYDVSYPGIDDRVSDQLRGELGSRPDGAPKFTVERVEMVGPAAGAELRRNAAIAVAFSLVLILIYTAFRFDLAFAPGGIIALFHDVMIAVLGLLLLRRDFSLQTIGALLTIVGYSINDTIVVYDRIRENMIRYPRRDLGEVINISLNETLSRTLLTSGVTLLSVVALILLGGPVVSDFAVTLFIGMIAGVYSSIYIATPLTLYLQRWLPVELGKQDDGGGGRSARSTANAGARL